MSQKPLELPENLKGTPPPQADIFPPIGMGPAVWGPIFWKTMHIVTIGYPAFPSVEEQKAAVSFFESLQFMIPCPICKEHYKENLKTLPLTDDVVGNKQKLIRWLFDMHNTINKQLGKQEINWREFVYSIAFLATMPKFSFQEAIDAQRTNYFDTQSLIYLVAGIGLGVGGFMAYKHFSK